MGSRGVYAAPLMGGGTIDLPMVPLDQDLGIALLMVNDEDFERVDRIVAGLCDLAWPLRPEATLGMPEQGIWLVHAVARKLGLARSFVVRKSPKRWEGDSISVRFQSITKRSEQSLYVPKSWAALLSGKRVIIVDDVISSGATVKAMLDAVALLSGWAAETIEVTGIVVAFTEGTYWRETLGERAKLVHSLGHLPLFRPSAYEAMAGT